MENLHNLINAHQDALTGTEKKISRYLLENESQSCYLSIQDLAAEVGTSPSAITRFVKKIGFPSYQQFRLKLAEASEKIEDPFFPEVSPEDSVLDIARTTFQCGISSLESTMAMLNSESLTKALDILSNAKICGLFGLGASQHMAEAFSQRCLRTSLQTFFYSDYHMQLMSAARLGPDDCALLISHSGRNEDAMRIMNILNENHVPVIVITSNPSSPIARKSSVFLFCISEETRYRPEAITSSVSQLLLIDTLFTLYAVKKDNDSEYFTRIRKVINSTRHT